LQLGIELFSAAAILPERLLDAPLGVAAEAARVTATSVARQRRPVSEPGGMVGVVYFALFDEQLH
jgi:hypothetical protein